MRHSVSIIILSILFNKTMSLITFSIPAEYFNAAHDVMRMVSIQVVVQFLFAVVNATENPFFSVLFLQTIMFVVIGVLFYWLIVHYLIQFKVSNNQKPSNTYSPATYRPLASTLEENEDTLTKDAVTHEGDNDIKETHISHHTTEVNASSDEEL